MKTPSKSDSKTGQIIALSIALRDCLSVFRADPLTTNVTEERVETWERVLQEHGAFDYPQGVKRGRINT